MFQTILEQVHAAHPLVHCITNYVTAAGCADLLLACGASPVMADDPGEVAEITAHSAALCLNLGTLRQEKISSLLLAGKTANRLKIPVVLDPVGAGASVLRTRTALQLLSEIRFTAVRANASELRALLLGIHTECGVDAAVCDRISDETLPQAVSLAKSFAAKYRTVTAMTGAIDIVTDGGPAYCIRNGHPMMRRITGSGCQLSALAAAFLGANPINTLNAAAAAVCAMGLTGELAYTRLGPLDGSGSYRCYMLDAMYHLTPAQLEEGARYELR